MTAFQDDKDTKTDPDIDEPSTSKEGDISPIDGPADHEIKDKPARKEPSSELRPNLSRVTPAQLRHISFNPDGRYQPVRAVSSRSVLSRRSAAGNGSLDRNAGGGGILILVDLRPQEEGEYIDISPEPIVEAPAPAANGEAVVAAPSGPHIALDESAPEADPPGAFEVSY